MCDMDPALHEFTRPSERQRVKAKYQQALARLEREIDDALAQAAGVA